MSSDSSSPLLRKTYAEPLTLELLAKKVPLVKEGHSAHQFLADKTIYESLDTDEIKELNKKIRIGKKAQESLIISALPLIKDISSREFSRRKAWNSKVSYEDILSEAISGFIRGLLSYKPAKTNHSATNYLGQWITTTIRRKTEVMEHDFFIPYDTIERNRKIIAIKARLANELNRNPTDEELLTALNNNEYTTDNKWGNANKTNQHAQKHYETKHLNTVKKMSDKMYSIQSQDAALTNDGDENTGYEQSAQSLSSPQPETIEDIEKEILRKAKADFYQNVFTQLNIAPTPADIITRCFGIYPYIEAQPYKEIAKHTQRKLSYVKNIIMTFNQYLPQKGGLFHHVILHTSEETIVNLELSWLPPILGEWPKNQPIPIPTPKVLTIEQ